MTNLENEPPLSKRKKKIFSIIFLIVFIVFFALVSYFIGGPMIRFVENPQKFQAWVAQHGIWGRIVFLGMQLLQVIVAIIPGEPLELGAGYAFGAIEGTALCVLGNTIGGIIIFALVRTWGIKIVDVFFDREKILSLKFLQNQKRFKILTFLVFALPGTPKDLLSYFAGLTNMNWGTWIFMTSIARLPSIVTSTISGKELVEKNYLFAAILLGLTLLLSGIGFLLYNIICKKYNSSKSLDDNNC